MVSYFFKALKLVCCYFFQYVSFHTNLIKLTGILKKIFLFYLFFSSFLCTIL